MAKITRKTQKILGGNSSNTGIFGNAQKGIYDQYSQDPDVIQTPEWESGWNQATFSGAKIPPLEERQAVDYVVTTQLAYILQSGVPEWLDTETYYIGNIARDSTGVLYKSIQDDNINNPLTDPLWWDSAVAGGVPDGTYGDITVSGSGTVWTINTGAVDTSKLGGDITTAGKALLDDADAAAQRTTLGLGTASLVNTGTGASEIPTNSLIPSFTLGQAQALIIQNNATAPNTKIDITSDAALLPNSTFQPKIHSAISLTIDTGTTGANGLDTGTLAASTEYHFWLISNGTTVAGLASLSPAAPTMPTGYTYKMRVGALMTGSSTTFIRVKQIGNRAFYTPAPSSATTAYPTIISGSLGDVSAPTWIAATVRGQTGAGNASFVPSTTKKLHGISKNGGGSVTIAAPNNTFGGYQSSNNPPVANYFYYSANNVSNFSHFEMGLESNNIYYASNSGSNGAVYAYGWTDTVNAT